MTEKKGNTAITDGRFHNTSLLLRKYRDVSWGMEISVTHAKRTFERKMGKTVEDFLDSMYLAGMDLKESQLEARTKNIQKSYQMLQLIDSSIEVMREKHRFGEKYYWILYYCYLSPQQYKRSEIFRLLEDHVEDISVRSYYRMRREAIQTLGGILWGYTDRDTVGLLEEFLEP